MFAFVLKNLCYYKYDCCYQSTRNSKNNSRECSLIEFSMFIFSSIFFKVSIELNLDDEKASSKLQQVSHSASYKTESFPKISWLSLLNHFQQYQESTFPFLNFLACENSEKDRIYAIVLIQRKESISKHIKTIMAL